VAPICRGNAMAAMTRSAAAAKTAEISSLRETPAHQDGNNRTSLQQGYAINGTSPIARIAAKKGWNGRMITPAIIAIMAYRRSTVSAAAGGQGRAAHCSDRVHAVGNDEEPAIQFGACLLI
jgi:hypothetical protein